MFSKMQTAAITTVGVLLGILYFFFFLLLLGVALTSIMVTVLVGIPLAPFFILAILSVGGIIEIGSRVFRGFI